MTVKAVFFDIDGTLVDSNECHVSAWERAFQEQLHPVDRAAIRRQMGKGRSTHEQNRVRGVGPR